MAKLTRNQKIAIYMKHLDGETCGNLSKEYRILECNIMYLVRIIEKHGFDILSQESNHYYRPKLKKEIINKVLIDGNSVYSTAIEYGLSSNGMLFNWTRSYKENNYIIVEQTKGRLPAMTPKKQKKK